MFAQLAVELPWWLSLLLLASPFLLPVALWISCKGILDMEKSVWERVAYALVPLAAGIAFGDQYRTLGRGHTISYSFNELLFGPLGLAGLASAALAVFFLLLFRLLRMAIKVKDR